MIRFALKSLAGRKLRTVLTALAIVLGVAMMSGAYVLTDTIDKAFDAIFVDSYAGTDAVVTGKDAGFSFEGESAEPPPIPDETLERVRAVDGVEVATGLGPGLPDEAAAARRRGDRHRRRAVVRVRHRDRARVRPLQPAQPRRGPLAERRRRGRRRRGRRRRGGPQARRPDRRRGARAGAAVRDRRHRQVRRPELDRRRDVRDLRRADGAEAAGQGGAARLGPGRRRGGRHARAADAADPGRARQRRHRPNRRRAGGRGRRASSPPSRRSSATSCSRSRAIALFVGAFVIFNTLSITVAQRMREFATLRTLGASRRQVLGSVILEALVIGLGASHRRPVQRPRARCRAERALQGAEPRPAADADGVRDAHDRRLAARRDARDARRRPLPGDPRDQGAADRRGPRGRDDAAGALRALHAVHRVRDRGARGPRARLRDARRRASRVGDRFALLGVGVLALFIGVAMLSSRLVRPLVSVVGHPGPAASAAPPASSPRATAQRNPGRTAATAAALMIGIALVTFVSVLAQTACASRTATRSSARSSPT